MLLLIGASFGIFLFSPTPETLPQNVAQQAASSSTTAPGQPQTVAPVQPQVNVESQQRPQDTGAPEVRQQPPLQPQAPTPVVPPPPAPAVAQASPQSPPPVPGLQKLAEWKFWKLIGKSSPDLDWERRAQYYWNQQFAKGDKNPMPIWNGQSPAKTLFPWLKAMRMWRTMTDQPIRLHGIILHKTFSGIPNLLDCANRVPEETAMNLEGYEYIMWEVLNMFKPFLDSELDFLVEDALYKSNRERQESLMSYITKKTAETT